MVATGPRLDVPGLPGMALWYSGLLPYPLLLPAQAVILAVQAWVGTDLARGAGFWVPRRPRLGRALYGLAMFG